MSSYGVVSTITAPVLKSVTQPDLIKLETEYTAYKEKVTDINRAQDASRQIYPASIKNCIDPVLLQSLRILGEIENADSVEEATDAAVKKWFDEASAAAPKDIAERARSSLDAVKYVPCKKDPAGAALTFVLCVSMELDKNNASEVVKDKETSKGLINKLAHKIEPPELRERVKGSRECWSSDEKSNLSFFRKKVSALAVDVAQEESVRARLGRKRGTGSCPHGPSGSKDREKSPRPLAKTKKNSQKFSRDRGPNTKKWDKPCLNPECPELHRVKDCSNTSEKRKKQLLEEHYAKKAPGAKVVSTPEEYTPETEQGRVVPQHEGSWLRRKSSL